MRKKKIGIFVLLIFISINLTGCWDMIELEEQGYVAAIGVDKGRGRNVRITFQIINHRAISSRGGQSSGESRQKSINISIEAPGILSASELLGASFTRRIALSHTKVIVVGQEFAQSSEFFRFLEASLREREVRRSMTLIVSREKAEDFMKNNNPALEDRINKFYEFMSRRWNETGLVPPYSNINRFMQRTEAKGSLFLSIYSSSRKTGVKEGADEGNYLPGQIKKEGGNPAEMIGAAVFRNGKMIGQLTGNEMRLVSFLREKPESKKMVITLEDPLDPKYRLGVRVTRAKRTRVKVDISGSKTRIDVKVPLSFDILTIPSFINYPEDLQKQEQLKSLLEEYLVKISKSLIKKTQEEFKGDPFQWELAARRKFYTYDEYQEYNWMKHYPEAIVNISYDIRLDSFGKQLGPPGEPESNEDVEDKVIE
jgi:spore germination protein KC